MSVTMYNSLQRINCYEKCTKLKSILEKLYYKRELYYPWTRDYEDLMRLLLKFRDNFEHVNTYY